MNKKDLLTYIHEMLSELDETKLRYIYRILLHLTR